MSGTAKLVLAAVLSLSLGCHHRTAPLVPSAAVDNDYVDLKAGDQLRITVPYFTDGAYVAKGKPVQESGSALTLSSSQLIGFEVSRYQVEGSPDGRVRLRFRSAETTRNGKPSEEATAPALPFTLPHHGRHVRLIYLVRSSQADHNMALVASRDVGELNAFTKLLRVNASACRQDGAVSCVWVPAGIAVRPE